MLGEDAVIENLPELPGFVVPSPTSSSEAAGEPHQSPMSTPSSAAPVRRPRWPWVVLGLGSFWTVLIRVPLVLNAQDHLDSDLAVDGLTLLDAVARTLAVALSRHALHGHPAHAVFVPAGPGLGGQSDHAGERRHDHLVTGRRLDVLAGGQGLRARGGGLGDRAAWCSRRWGRSGCRDESPADTC